MASYSQDDSILTRASAIEHKLKNLFLADMLPRLVRMKTGETFTSFEIKFREADAEKLAIFAHFLEDQRIPYEIDGDSFQLDVTADVSSFLNGFDKALQIFEAGQIQSATAFNHHTLFTTLPAMNGPNPSRLPPCSSPFK